ncbi:hypothetical protein HOLleu_11372 [Holothuria leucospilota]|uniref:Uncharacterized protein n=1 Tax=Holothuria leucospilota TaxID=206669 RepID=A0A9Q1CFJ2_HOLLE|nr:hypothetical protein HOLleu_11372 [Holothuria leucospilota]
MEERDESPVNIEGFETNEWRIDNITGVDDGSIVITGHNSPNCQSHITVININGKVQRRKELKNAFPSACRFCAYLSKFKIATVCWYNEIGVFDVRDYSYIKKNIHEVIRSWPKYGQTWCVTTDPVSNHILVGRYDSRDVYVFDDQLNYHHTLTLPEMIKYPYLYDVAFSEGNLVVCDFINKRAYYVTFERQRGKVTHELTKPDCDGDDWGPLSVCIDSNGFIYILWMTGKTYTAGRRIFVRYTQNGSHSVTQKEVDSNDARCIATVKANFITEKLLVASFTSGRLRFYTII